MDVHIRELRYFVEVAQRLHFTRAAEALSVSQPALSKQLRALETQVGAALLHRDHRTVRLTAAGEALLPHARQILSTWACAEEDVAAVVTAAAARLTVGMSTAPSRGLWPAVRHELAMTASHLTLQLRQVPWRDATAGLADPASGVDAALVWLPVPDSHRFAWSVITEEPRMVALRANHPLTRRDEIEFTDLLDEPFLALPESSGPLRAFWLALDHRAGRAAHVGGEIDTAEETAEAVAAGIGIALVAAGNEVLLARPDITVRPVTGLSPATLALMWRRGDHRPALTALRAAVATAAGRQGLSG